MWQCPKCDEQLEDAFDACWNCGTEKDGLVATGVDNSHDEECQSDDPQEEAHADLESDEDGVARPSSILMNVTGVALLHVLIVFPLAIAVIFWSAPYVGDWFGLLVGAVCFLLPLPLWFRVCGESAACWSAASWLLAIVLLIKFPLASLPIAAHTIFVIYLGSKQLQKTGKAGTQPTA